MSGSIRLELGSGKYLVAGEIHDPKIKGIYVGLEDDQGRTVVEPVIVSLVYDWGNMKPMIAEDLFEELVHETEYRFDSKYEWEEWNNVVQSVTERHQTEKDFDEAYSYALEAEKEGSAGTYFDMNFHSVAVHWANIPAETMRDVFGRYGQSELHLSPSGRGFSVTYY